VTAPAASRQLDRIRTLDGLRAVAILLVILSHAIDRDRFTGLAEVGHVGVMIFFALSGFLITSRLLDEYRSTGGISLRNFYVRRVFRILPPAILFLAILWLLTMTGLVECTDSSIRSALLLYTNYADVGSLGWRAGHFWSLSVEEHFYLVWPSLLLCFGVLTGWRTAVALIAAIALWRIGDNRFHILASVFGAPYLQGFVYRTDLIADALFWGCALAFVEQLRLGAPLSTAAAVVSMTLMVLFALEIHVPGMPRNIDYSIPIMHVLPAILLAAVVACPTAMIGRLLELAPMRFLGKLSYSLYIWQQLFLGGPGPRLPAILGLAAAFTCAYLSYRFIEQPCIRFGRQWIVRRALVPAREPV
jgi:peptidoglycan/LPS O-acetylase OafA/YrhL